MKIANLIETQKEDYLYLKATLKREENWIFPVTSFNVVNVLFVPVLITTLKAIDKLLREEEDSLIVIKVNEEVNIINIFLENSSENGIENLWEVSFEIHGKKEDLVQKMAQIGR